MPCSATRGDQSVMIVRMFVPSDPTTKRAVHRVLGIDPGLTRCGYAVVDAHGPQSVNSVSLGVLRTPPTMPLPERLAGLHHDISELLREFEPQTVVVEQLFFQVNVRTAMSVGQASGLALAWLQRPDAPSCNTHLTKLKRPLLAGEVPTSCRFSGWCKFGSVSTPCRNLPTLPTLRHWRCVTLRYRPCIKSSSPQALSQFTGEPVVESRPDMKVCLR